MFTNKHVLLGMSGGLDSSVAALLLKELGYKVSGLTLRTYDYISTGCLEKQSGCCTVDSIFDAKKLMESLSFEHHVMDVRNEFNAQIIKYFISEYLGGRTPNPCVLCNSLIKWAYMLQKADELGCDYIATGHYANIRFENERYILSEGADKTKDQSYFLWGLSQDVLKRTIFPLGNFQKTEIRDMAAKHGLKKLTQKRESQEICFIQDDDYRGFLKSNIPDMDVSHKPGNFISVDGKILGTHKGIPFYTIGQRKGLEVAVGHPLYVIEIKKDSNELVLGIKDDLGKTSMIVRDYNLVKYNEFNLPSKVRTKIRYRSKAIPSVIHSSNNEIQVDFEETVFGITPGQSAVFYENEDVLGGGIIFK